MVGHAYGYSFKFSPNHSEIGPIQTFLSRFQLVFDKMVLCPDFRSNSKSKPFATQLFLNHKKSRKIPTVYYFHINRYFNILEGNFEFLICYPFDLCYFKCRFSTDRIKQGDLMFNVYYLCK